MKILRREECIYSKWLIALRLLERARDRISLDEIADICGVDADDLRGIASGDGRPPETMAEFNENLTKILELKRILKRISGENLLLTVDGEDFFQQIVCENGFKYELFPSMIELELMPPISRFCIPLRDGLRFSEDGPGDYGEMLLMIHLDTADYIFTKN